MNSIKTLAAAAVLSLAAAGGAQADWTGFYAGVQVDNAIAPGPEYLIQPGVHMGFNFGTGNFIGGVELSVAPFIFNDPGPTVYCCGATGDVRLGFAMGDRALLFGSVGVMGIDNDGWWRVGGGAEFMLANGMSLFGVGRYVHAIGDTGQFFQVGVGLNIRR